VYPTTTINSAFANQLQEIFRTLTVVMSLGFSLTELLVLAQVLQDTYSSFVDLPKDISELLIEVSALREVLHALLKVPIHDGTKDPAQSSQLDHLVLSCERTLTDIQQEC
jgi:hypothetical protein